MGNYIWAICEGDRLVVDFEGRGWLYSTRKKASESKKESFVLNRRSYHIAKFSLQAIKSPPSTKPIKEGDDK